MSRLTLRRKGAIGSAVISAAGLLGAAVPMSASGATGLTINLQTTPGITGAGGGTVFVAPTFASGPAGSSAAAATTVYVYATVTGTGSTTASDFQRRFSISTTTLTACWLFKCAERLSLVWFPRQLLTLILTVAASLGDTGSGFGDQSGVATGATTPGLVLGSRDGRHIDGQAPLRWCCVGQPRRYHG